jgi:hypothetical protein
MSEVVQVFAAAAVAAVAAVAAGGCVVFLCVVFLFVWVVLLLAVEEEVDWRDWIITAVSFIFCSKDFNCFAMCA